MIKTTINVPAGIRYMTDWEKLEGGYSLNDYPFPHILDKQITGCGFTEYCIRNGMNIVICSPRRILLENKTDQHQERSNIFYFKNDIDSINYDCDLFSKAIPKDENSDLTEEKKAELEETKFRQIESLKSQLEQKLVSNSNNRLPSKILVTYDSFRHVKDVLVRNGVLDKFFIVVDEFQSIFVDSKFKSTTEMELLNQLRGIQKVCFVSATPMLSRYLEMLDEFKDLPYYEFDWSAEEPGRIIKPDIIVHQSKSVIYDINNVVKNYLQGNFEVFTYRDQGGNIQEIVSNEAVIFVNSVKNICDIIRKCGLTPDNTNVLCADTKENLKKVRAAFRASCKMPGGIGTVPKYGELHKMFTLCTRTVYLGADFYSTCARSFIVSDANIDTLSVDITLDLPQILGRQRLIENPWKNRVELYFKPLKKGKAMTKEDFDKILEDKQDRTMKLLDVHSNLSDSEAKYLIAAKYESAVKVEKYVKDFVAIDHFSGSSLVPVLNKLVMVAEMRTFDIQQIDYKDRVSVLNTLSEDYTIGFDRVDSLVAEIENNPIFSERMKMVCNSGLDQIGQARLLNQLPMYYGVYYNVLGPERIKALEYRKEYLSKEINNLKKKCDNITVDRIVQSFKVGEKYPRNVIKEELSKIYSDLDITKAPKASDLSEYFDIKPCTINTNVGGERQRVNGYEILKLKDML